MGKDLNGKDLGKGYSQRKDGRYEARAMVNGVRLDLYDTSLAKLKKDFEAQKTLLLRNEKNVRANLTLSEWFDEWFTTCKAPQLKSDISRKSYRRRAQNTYVRILGDKKIEDISQINIQDATYELCDENYQYRTISEALGILRECFEVGIVNNVAKVNPCICINIRDHNAQKERRVMTHKEQDIFLNEVKNDYYYEAYAILLLTGIRIGEFSGLQWDDIDFEKKEIHIRRSMQTAYIDGRKIEELTTPKTNNSYRTIPFFGETEQMFLEWQKKQAIYKKKLGSRWRANPEHGDLVFTSTVGSPVTRYVLAHDIKKVVNNINMKEIYAACRDGRKPVLFENLHPHAFRHTFATRCFEKGMEPVFVQSIMGHSNYSTTLSYTHILDDIKRKEVQKVGNFFD